MGVSADVILYLSHHLILGVSFQLHLYQERHSSSHQEVEPDPPHLCFESGLALWLALRECSRSEMTPEALQLWLLPSWNTAATM